MTVLLVEDNANMRAALVRGIAEQGFAVEVEETGKGALKRLGALDVAAVILDLGLPDIDGLDVLVTARANGLLVPVLVLTARDAIESRVTALDRGADDYLIKPFAFAELIARLRSLMRRSQVLLQASPAFGDLRMRADGPAVLAGGRSIPLSPREHALLQFLVRSGATVRTRREIFAEAFGYEFDPGTNVIDVHITHLRRKLAGAKTRIESVRGIGYRLQFPNGDARERD